MSITKYKASAKGNKSSKWYECDKIEEYIKNDTKGFPIESAIKFLEGL